MIRGVRVNEAEHGTARSSAYGRGFRAMVTGRIAPAQMGSRGVESAQGAGFVREQPPVLMDYVTFRDFFGSFAARVARTQNVVRIGGYSGQLPMDQQPTVKRVNPWNDPSRGLP